MTAYLLDWCGLLVRWLHIIAGIAWIGSSFYFVWLDNSLEPLGEREPADPRVAGELWSVHGGGFYRSRKYRVAPEVLPPTLHWFYWEAYTTWLSGFGLLCLLYFLRAEAYLIDPAIMALSKPVAITIAAAAIVVSWLVYDGLCRSPLGQRPRALALAVAVVTALEAWGLCQIFSGRGAFMMFGVALGSIMVANVLFIIIPGQRELIRAKLEGREPDAAPGLRGKQRSVHNTYFTLPVLFVMISNHYAMTYGARNNWLVLIAMSFAGACIRGWFVARQKPAGRHGVIAALPAAAGVVTLLVLIVSLAPATGRIAQTPPASSAAFPPAVDVAQVQAIVQQRCVPCHSKSPTQPGFTAPPNGIALQTLDELRAHLPEIQKQVSLRTMPLGNLTAMTDEERVKVLMWIGHGGSGWKSMTTLEELNACPVAEFVASLGAIYEHSPWVAERAAAGRPFNSKGELLTAMCATVRDASPAEQLALIRAHPQLGARGRNRAQLTAASAHEQQRAGLDACTDEEFAELMQLNAAYVQKFAFPCILAVRGHTPHSILAALTTRLSNDVDTERAAALAQIDLIAGFRLADVVMS